MVALLLRRIRCATSSKTTAATNQRPAKRRCAQNCWKFSSRKATIRRADRACLPYMPHGCFRSVCPTSPVRPLNSSTRGCPQEKKIPLVQSLCGAEKKIVHAVPRLHLPVSSACGGIRTLPDYETPGVDLGWLMPADSLLPLPPSLLPNHARVARQTGSAV